MNFSVAWTRAARDQLAEVWLNHPNQASVTAAAHRVDVLLSRDPDNQGEERPNNCRIMFESPLMVRYRIDRTRNRVVVNFVGRY